MLEDLKLFKCNGFDEIELSSPSIKKLDITMAESTAKATIDAPSIKEFHYVANISQSISFTTTSSEWNSEIHVSLDLDASLWFHKLSELVEAFIQSQFCLGIYHYFEIGNSHIEHPSDISICCGGGSYYKSVAMKSLHLSLSGVYYDFFSSGLVIGLFRFVRPREIIQFSKDDFLWRTLQMGRWEEEDEGMRGLFFWQQDLEQVSLQVYDGCVSDKWRPMEGTTSWSEYVAASNKFSAISFRLKWRE